MDYDFQMYNKVVLKSVHLSNFRNYKSWETTFEPGVILIFGPNGIGKTNLLDAIYLSCIGRGYFTSLDKNLIRKGEGFYRIQTFWSSQSIQQVVVKKQKSKPKVVEVNRQVIEKLVDFIGRLPVVMIVPDDKELIDGTNEYRRKFVNATLSQMSQQYLESLGIYYRILAQRNKYLKSCVEAHRKIDLDLISTFDKQLSPAGYKIYSERSSFFDEFNHLFLENYQVVAGKQEHVSLSYNSQLQHNEFDHLLAQNLNKDKILGRTSAGIHRDKIEINMNDQPFKNIASQGQKKTAVFALKFAQYQFLVQCLRVYPILLLDDVFDKLDKDRIHRLINLIDSVEYGQTILTDTQADRFLENWMKQTRNKSLQLVAIEPEVLTEEEE